MGLFDKFKQALAKTSEKISVGIRTILSVGRNLDDTTIDHLEEILYGADLGPTTAFVIDEARKSYKLRYLTRVDQIPEFLHKQLVGRLEGCGGILKIAPSKPTVILVCGVNGSGKTTSIAKLANYLKKQGHSIVLGAGDTFRAAAVEQLTIWAERAGVPIIKRPMGADPASVAYDAVDAGCARGADFVIIDTAGRLHTQQHLMAELEKITRVVKKRVEGAPHEVLLVLDSTTGQNMASQAELFSKAAPVTGLVLAKLDGTAKGGAVFGLREKVKIPVKFIGLGEKIDDLEAFDPKTFVDAIVEPFLELQNQK
ncbi:MAG: signal recognition particle-docking protein FtsY [Planctomycetes bacterium]|nr:signal recognition particle-docking protein FtsY [Planctomycetota bacterium]